MSQDTHVDPVRNTGVKLPTDGFAIAALICAILGFVPLGLAFGIVALVRTTARRRSGRGLAITALVISGLWGIAGAVAVVLAMQNTPPQAAPATSAVKLPPGFDTVLGYLAGGCFDRVPPGERVQPAVCLRPHDEQVIARVGVNGADWPGNDAVKQQVDAGCREEYRSYFLAGKPAADVQLKQYLPGEADWDNGTHYGVCTFASSSGKLNSLVPR